ncbi:MAG: cyclopropane-fatty-acyl-phospholipid synthase [Phycisphaerales bacterium]|nr:cyclopropane-fatty-acyl-phospholipid synthase [Phycisphaerales bacterium]
MSHDLINKRPRRNSGRAGASRRIARGLITSKLDAIRGGHLLIQDADDERLCGDATRPGHRLIVHDTRFYSALLQQGSLGAAEAWIRGWWSCDELVPLLRLMIRNLEHADGIGGWRSILRRPFELLAQFKRSNTLRGSRRNIRSHYDLSNDFLKLFLDDTMTYSSGVFRTPQSTLLEASEYKLDRLISMLDIDRDSHLLEIGTGWGSMAIRAATSTGCRVTTTTLSVEQATEARIRIKEAGLDGQIEVLETDYRLLVGKYDAIVSVEMIEAVGHRYLPAFFQSCNGLLKPEGRLVMQAISMPDDRYDRYLRTTDFIRTHIFPGSCCPSVKALDDAAMGRTDFKPVHLDDMAPHYARTLNMWRNNFMERLDDVTALGLDEEFIRMWEYYLAYCEAGFAERYIRSIQLVYDRPQTAAMPDITPVPDLDIDSLP